jgi:hypothetical protein
MKIGYSVLLVPDKSFFEHAHIYTGGKSALCPHIRGRRKLDFFLAPTEDAGMRERRIRGSSVRADLFLAVWHTEPKNCFRSCLRIHTKGPLMFNVTGSCSIWTVEDLLLNQTK